MPNQDKVFKRHIFINDIEKAIYIEVKQNAAGRPINADYDLIKAGDYRACLPPEILGAVHKAINDGFHVVPFFAIGWENIEYRIIQIVDMHTSPIIHLQ